MKIKYFSWIRERLNLEEETVELPENVETLGALLDWQATRGDNFTTVFEDPEIIRVALNMKHETDPQFSLDGITEIAMFPPMTGG